MLGGAPRRSAGALPDVTASFVALLSLVRSSSVPRPSLVHPSSNPRPPLVRPSSIPCRPLFIPCRPSSTCQSFLVCPSSVARPRLLRAPFEASQPPDHRSNRRRLSGRHATRGPDQLPSFFLRKTSTFQRALKAQTTRSENNASSSGSF